MSDNKIEMTDANKKVFDMLDEAVKNAISQIPKFDIVPLNINPEWNYKNFKDITENNSKYGWTLTGEFNPFGAYVNKDFLKMTQAEIDMYFMKYYSQDDHSYYKVQKRKLISKLDSKWKDLIDECFNSYESKNYKVTIPSLITIVEGELSSLINSRKGGYKLMEDFKRVIDQDDEKIITIAALSLQTFLQGDLFASWDFNKERLNLLNRNWILHGRDNPKYWSEIDFIRLINVLSTITFIKQFLK